MNNGNKDLNNETPISGETEKDTGENTAPVTSDGADSINTASLNDTSADNNADSCEKHSDENAASTASPDTESDFGNLESQRNAATPNAAEILNSYLFSSGNDKITPPKPDTKKVKNVFKLIGVLLLTMAVAFSGAFACLYWVCDTALLGDSDFFRAIIMNASGVKVNKVEVDMISGDYKEDTVALAEKIMQHSIDIQIFDSDNQRTGSGSGVILSESGLAITNYHVVYGNETTLKAVLSDGTVCGLSVLHLDKISDLAIVQIDTNKKLTPATWGDSSKVKTGQSVVICGNPLGLGFSVSFGNVSHPDRDLGEVAGNFIQVDASVNPGNSGGGLYDGAGNLIGIINSKASGNNVDGIGYAIPASRALEVIDDLLSQGYVGGRPAIGFTLVQVNQSTWDYFKNGDGTEPGQLHDYLYESKYGIYIIESKYNTEILKGDRIISCNGTEFTDRDAFSQWLLKYKAGDTVTITVERIVSVTQNPDGSYKVVRERKTFDCVLRERDWIDEPYAK